MTNAVADKPKEKAPAAVQQQPAKILFQGQVGLDKIDVVSNIRKTYNSQKMKELVESVRGRGVNQPVLLRPSDKSGRYVLVAGHRRVKAAGEVGLKEVPAIVKDLTAEQGLIDQAQETLQREDLTPIEEARGYKLLTQPTKDGKDAKYTVEQLAELVNKSTGQVYRSMRLLELPKRVLDAIESDELTPEHGHQLLRVANDDKKAFEDLVEFCFEDDWETGERPTAKRLKQQIDDEIGRDLARAAWPKDKPYAGEQACSTCPYNSGNQQSLFPGATKGTCLKASCYGKKHEAFELEAKAAADKKAAELKTKHGAQFLGIKDERIDQGDLVSGGVALCPVGSKNEKNIPEKDRRVAVGNDGKAWVVTTNKASIKKVLGHVPWGLSNGGNRSSGGGRPVKKRSPKECFMESWIEKQFFLKLCAETKPAEMLAMIVDEVTPGYMSNSIRDRVALLGINGEAGLKRAFAELKSDADKLRFAFKITLAKRTAYGAADSVGKELGLEFSAFNKASKAAAEKAWEDRKSPKTSAPAKKGAKK